MKILNRKIRKKIQKLAKTGKKTQKMEFSPVSLFLSHTFLENCNTEILSGCVRYLDIEERHINALDWYHNDNMLYYYHFDPGFSEFFQQNALSQNKGVGCCLMVCETHKWYFLELKIQQT